MISKTILILNGPNLNLLGKRQPEIYGSLSFEEFFDTLLQTFEGVVELEYFQSNHEGDLLDKIHEYGFEAKGIVINAGAYTHTSIALMDAVKGIACPCVEVHISNIYERESFRHQSYVKEACVHSIVGKGLKGYEDAINYLLEYKPN